MRHERFKLRTLEDLEREAKRLAVDIPVDNDLTILGKPMRIGDKAIANRLIVQPMEGFDADESGTPGELSLRRYGRYAAGGSGLIWFEATAVVPEGRGNPAQFWINEKNVDEYRKLVAHTRAVARRENGQDIVLILQLTHSGRYSKPAGFPEPIIAHHSPILDRVHNLPDNHPLVKDEYLDDLQAKYVEAAELAERAGFDGVDVKACHRYLVSELLASFERPGRYGTTFEGRTRMLRETMAAIGRRCGGLMVTTRINVYDAMAHPYGFGVDKTDTEVPDLVEPLHLVGMLCEAGLPVLNVSIGNPYYNPEYGRPFDFPIKGKDVPGEHPLEAVSRFLYITRAVQEAYPDLPVVGGGYSWLRHLMPYVAAAVVKTGGASLIGQGRGAFAYPDSINDILEKGRMDPERTCVACSGCTQIMRDGGRAGCVVRDSKIYGPAYRKARRFAPDRLKEEAARCRDCAFATCSSSCPAGVDVPRFIRAFLRDDIAGAYSELRKANVLSETCAFVCPSAELCEGGCLEDIFCESPVPVRDIQLFVARAARLKGLTAVNLPSRMTGKTVAVIGGGPAGIACAVTLLERGHHVHLYEAGTSLGGVPKEIVPGERIAREAARVEIEAIIAPALAKGRLTVRYGAALGGNITLKRLQAGADAVVLAVGLSGSVSLGWAGRVVDALKFLADIKSGKTRRIEGKVAVLGGGNTAMDAATAAVRLGAEDVYLVYRRSFAEMPAWKEELETYIKSGGHILTLTQPLSYVEDDHGGLIGVRIVRTELGGPDASGRRTPRAVPGSESVLSVDMAVEAIGQTLSEPVRDELRRVGVGLTARGLIEIDEDTFLTSVPGIYAVGDAVNGGTTAVRAVAEGMRAARSVLV